MVASDELRCGALREQEEAEAHGGLRAAAAEGGGVEGSGVPWGPLSSGALVSTKQQLKKH
jgi:hypothetical protein